ncbi:polymerase [Paenibacillus darwinianus]|uniref:Polymerase n=1 Tax=Paenibacillus darwinianus TaxID=1380763 RepID=A0A9W5S369_9BACL|nr:FapA family protein [Paenibacillus darwinianus]EXX91270.1 polymerase [Paenibacillus darwinianus]EXX92208.1 polymerase [Paenibacillus darwinianus]EXX92818.1 polymerase [Paenibacillus darwinianus]
MSNLAAMETNIGIELAPDQLSAILHFNKADEAFAFTAEELEQFLKSHGVVFGIHNDVLASIALNPKHYFYGQTVIATGNPPLDGKDGFIHYAFNMEEESLKPALLEDGTVDYKEVIQLKNVIKGQLIAELVPAEEGHPGTAVTGEKLNAKHGKTVRFKVGKNVVLNPEQNAMYAAIDGMIAKTDKDKINVFPVFEVNGDVDYNIGNIDFVGTVVIRGNVLTGFRVKAAGDIRVVGGVEGAELEADGSIEITGGILAGNKGFVKAGKTVRSSFIQDGNVLAGEDIVVTQSIMHSQVRAAQSIVCSGAKGLLVGGIAQAGDKVTARTIGNTMSTATAIEVGVHPALRAELNELRSQLKEMSESLDKMDKALTLLDQLAAAGQLSPDKLALRVKLNATKRQVLDEQNVGGERILAIEKMLEDTGRAKVEVINTVYGGTKIVIGRYTRFVKDPVQRVCFRYSEGDINMAPLV